MARTRAADFEDKQRAILASAATVFADLGMEKASMAEIAARSNVSKALLYHYYPSKDALIFAIVRTHLTALEDAIKATDDPALAAEARLRLAVRQILECYRDADDKHKVQLTAMSTLPPEEAEELRVIERRIVRHVSGLIQKINPKLAKNRALLTPVTMSLFGMLNWVYTWFRPDGPVSREQYADIATTLILDGLKAVR